MKRDMDVVRKIALNSTDLPAGHALVGVDGVEGDVFREHVRWMSEAGLVHAVLGEDINDVVVTATVRRLSWAGCEFADAVRSETVWHKAKAQVLKPAGSFTFAILLEWLKAEITRNLPTLGG